MRSEVRGPAARFGDYTMQAQRLISADSHVNEPSDLWQTRLDRKFRDRAPYIARNEKGPGFLFVVPGVMATQIAGGFAAGKSGHELREHMSSGYEGAPRRMGSGGTYQGPGHRWSTGGG